jgi:hypothetical protein
MAMRHLPVLLFTLVSATNAQSWSFAPFGTGCWDLASPSWPNTPVMSTSGQATPGFTLTILYGGPTAYNAGTGPFYEYRPALILGLSNQSVGALPLPWTLPSAFTAQPCRLYVSTDVIEVMNPVNAWSYASSYDLPIPNNAQLLGLTFFAQWAVFYNTIPIFGPPGTTVSTSHGAAITIGF